MIFSIVPCDKGRFVAATEKPASPFASKATWIGFLFSAGAIVLLLWRVSFKDLGAALGRAELVWLIPSVLVFLVVFMLRALRWALLLGGTRFWPTWHANIIGYMFNVIFPLRLGEIARAYVIAKEGNVSLARALSACVVERLLDLAAVVLMFAYFTTKIPLGPNFTRAATVAAVLVVAGVFTGAFIVVMGDTVERIGRPRLARLGKERVDVLFARFHEIRDGFKALGTTKRAAQTLLLTIAIWATTILLSAFAMRAFIPDALTEPARPSFVVVIANLGGALPSAPGGLGIVQAFATSALVVPFNVPEPDALAFVLVWSLGGQLVLIVLGIISLGRVGLSLSDVRAGASKSKADPKDQGSSVDRDNKDN